MQSRKHSALEASLNTASGFVLSLAAGEFIFPLLGWPLSHEQNLEAVMAFTVISVIRSYAWRRGFNWWHSRPKGDSEPSALCDFCSLGVPSILDRWGNKLHCLPVGAPVACTASALPLAPPRGTPLPKEKVGQES